MHIAAHLNKFPFAAYATEDEMKIVSQYAYIMPFGKGEVIHTRSQGECLGAVVVLSGALCASMISDEGKQILLYRLEEGEACAFTAQCVLNLLSYETVVEGEADGSILVVPVTALNIVMKNIMARNAMNELAIRHCSQIMRALERVLFFRVDKRLAQCLLDHAQKHGRQEVHLTHEQIAREISSAREVVSRILSRFVKKGLIQVGRGTIIITDPDGLREYK